MSSSVWMIRKTTGVRNIVFMNIDNKLTELRKQYKEAKTDLDRKLIKARAELIKYSMNKRKLINEAKNKLY